MSREPPADTDSDRVVVLNPASGDADHAPEVRERAAAAGFAVRETEAAGEAIDLARAAAADGAGLVAAAGGDGTVNEVVRGLVAAGALDATTLGVVPCGTGNDFAGNVAVTGIEHAFEVLADGERRTVDLGFVRDRPFVNSCVGGLTADASAETSPALKEQFGTLAYVITTLRTLRTFDGVRVSVEVFDENGSEPLWAGDAFAVLVGNARRFGPGGSTQADVEDGLFDVTVVRESGTISLLGHAAAERLLARESPAAARHRAPSLLVDVKEDAPVSFSLDGEIITRHRLSLHTRPRALRVAVGESYEPDPGD